MRRVSVAVIAVLGVMLVTADSGARQTGQSSQPGQMPQTGVRLPGLDNDDTPRPIHDRMEAQAARGRNTERHKKLVDDTSKLLQLSTELKSEVDKTTKDEMSVQVIQKAAEIEKLARDVKERMKG